MTATGLSERDQRLLDEFRRWQLYRFVSLGFGCYEAEVLESAHVDWREAASLLARGCPHDTALLILL